MGNLDGLNPELLMIRISQKPVMIQVHRAVSRHVARIFDLEEAVTKMTGLNF